MFCLHPLSLNQNKKSSNYFSEAAIVSSLLLPKTKMKKFYGGFTIQTKYLSSSNIETSRLRIFWGMSWILFQLFIWYIVVSCITIDIQLCSPQQSKESGGRGSVMRKLKSLTDRNNGWRDLSNGGSNGSNNGRNNGWREINFGAPQGT